MAVSAYRTSAWWVLLISAFAWWACGFLPWLLQALYVVTGISDASAAGGNSFLPLPFIADDAVVGLAVMALFGGLLGGVAAGLPASSRAGAGAAITGTFVAMAATGGVSWWISIRASVPGDAAPLGMLVITGVAGSVGLLAGLLTALGPAALRGLTLALPVVLLDGWLWGLLPGNSVSPTGTWWIFAVALGIAFGLAVDTKPIELLGWLPAAGLVWVLQAAGPALAAVQGDVSAGSALTEDALTAAGIVWDELASAAVVSDGHQLGAWVVALLLGATIAALRLSREASDEVELSEAWA
ncbi:hypothetical protein APR04_005360 [Promicromonospora umidemergens]|uniref:hypothetical protein n=1 Tax=Promicromonospora umidemergens TaxID=629679 RepID=UPI0020A505D8|nr:hypothetical protein [Promicromonospora umidemergens]MCP2286423.1 hypothetical protein [Promicromonospora umidemergens]